jgi:hypothetical protein
VLALSGIKDAVGFPAGLLRTIEMSEEVKVELKLEKCCV